MLFSAHPPKHPTFWKLSSTFQHQPAHSHHSQSFRHCSLLAAQEDWRQTPENIQLPQQQAPSLWELERGTEHDSPHRGLLILSPRGAKLEFRELEVREQADVCSERWCEGEDHQLLPASVGLTVLECPFLSFSPHLWPVGTTLLCPAWGCSPCHTPPPGPGGQQKEKQGGHCWPPPSARLIFPKRKSAARRVLFPRRGIPSRRAERWADGQPGREAEQRACTI